MTMIDEGALRALLTEAADGVALPATAVDRIVSAASEDRPTTNVVRSIVPSGRLGRRGRCRGGRRSDCHRRFAGIRTGASVCRRTGNGRPRGTGGGAVHHSAR
jgi:hypothetical protein